MSAARRRRVVVTGMGVISALGDSPAALATALCDGTSALRPIQTFDRRDARCATVAEIGDFAPHEYLVERSLHPLDRTSRLAASAAELALRDRGWDASDCRRLEVGLVLGTMFGSVHTISEFDRKGISAGPAYAKPMAFANSVINAAAGQTAIWHGLCGLNATVSGGNVSGVQALAHAVDLIRQGRADALLAGGVEEVCFESFYGFDRAGLLCGSDNGNGELPIPFDARRNGIALGEAAALLVLEDSETARARGARPVAEIHGHGSGFDCSRGKDLEQSAAALARAMRCALQDAGSHGDDIVCLSASANGSARGDLVEAQGIVAALGESAKELPVTAIKSMLGETLGAAGVLQAVTLIEALRSGVLPGIRGLERVDERVPLAGVGPHVREIGSGLGLVTGVGLTGGHTCLVVATEPAETG